MTINIPMHAIVIVIGHKRRIAEMAAICDAIGGFPSPWDIQKPAASLELLHEAMRSKTVVPVHMKHSHAAARTQAASAARKRGYASIVLRLPGADEVGADERHDAVHDVADASSFAFRITPMACDMRDVTSPLDFIGDVHGCLEELIELLVAMGHADPVTKEPIRHAQGRRPVLLGDLVDRGPENLGVMLMVRRMEAVGAIRVLGNHDHKVARHLLGREVEIAPAIETTIAQTCVLPIEEQRELGGWLMSAQPHVVLDEGRVVAAHAGIDERNQGSMTPGAHAFGLYGKTSGKIDENGRIIREDWAKDYEGEAVVVHGHEHHAEVRVLNGVYAIDTGCVFGGRLTAFHWPERTFTSVAAKRIHCDSHATDTEEE
jgi:hypothetical protein